MGNALRLTTIQDARIGAHRMTVACPNSSTSASQKQHHAGWSSIKLPPRRHPCFSPVHSIEREHVSRRQREASTEPASCTPHAAPPASECRRQAVETMAQWPMGDPGPVKARLLDGGVTRHPPSWPGLLRRNHWGTPSLLRYFPLSLVLTRELSRAYLPKRTHDQQIDRWRWPERHRVAGILT
jgi:hypothetical protein